MGRAIDVDKRLDKLEHDMNELWLILEELSRVNTTQEHIDIHEATKEEKTNDEGNGESSDKLDNGKSKKSNRNSKNTKSSM